jgi:predicted membrane-bound mannosyltransferase
MQNNPSNLATQTGAKNSETPRWFWPVLAVIVLASCLLRFWDLSADPFPFHLGGVEVDEGYWIHNARLAALGFPQNDDLVHAEAAGPLASRLIQLCFEVGGVHFVTARLPSFVTGLGLVLVVGWFAYTAWGWRHGLIATFFVGFADILVTYSRLAVVESQMTFFSVCCLNADNAPHKTLSNTWWHRNIASNTKQNHQSLLFAWIISRNLVQRV